MSILNEWKRHRKQRQERVRCVTAGIDESVLSTLWEGCKRFIRFVINTIVNAFKALITFIVNAVKKIHAKFVSNRKHYLSTPLYVTMPVVESVSIKQYKFKTHEELEKAFSTNLNRLSKEIDKASKRQLDALKKYQEQIDRCAKTVSP